jgi:uncharacterized protein HemX
MQEKQEKKSINLRVGSEYQASASEMVKKIKQLEVYIKKIEHKIDSLERKLVDEQNKGTDQKKIDLGLEILKVKKKKFNA